MEPLIKKPSKSWKKAKKEHNALSSQGATHAKSSNISARDVWYRGGFGIIDFVLEANQTKTCYIPSPQGIQASYDVDETSATGPLGVLDKSFVRMILHDDCEFAVFHLVG